MIIFNNIFIMNILLNILHLLSKYKWVIPCEITKKSAILTPTLFDFDENW